MKNTKINIHYHTIGIEHVAKRMFGIVTAWVDKNPTKRLKLISGTFKVIGWIVPGKDAFERYSRLVKNIDLSTEDKIKLGLKSSGFLCIYTMDFENCKAGEVPVSYEKQLDELIALKEQGYPIKIFMHLDNRRPKLLELAAKYASKVDGWKLYPPLSGYPDDYIILYILDYYPKEVVIHCTDTSPIFYHGYVRNYGGSQKDNCQRFLDMNHIERLIKRYPETNFNLCHGGGGNNVMRLQIISLCQRYANCYTESSYESNKEYFNEIYSKIPTKALFGTDAIMCDDFELPHMDILQENNRRFLKL